MASVDEVLTGMSEPAPEDEELCFVIDRDLRIIGIPERGRVLGVEGDKDVNRVRFKMPRYYRGTDLAGFEIRIYYENADGERNIAAGEDKSVSNDAIRFTWVVGADALEMHGNVRFMVRFIRLDESGNAVQVYGTGIGSGANLEGMNAGE